MLNKKYFLSIVLILFLSIGFKSTNDLSDVREPLSFIDLNDKKTMDEIYQKILNYQSIEGQSIRHISILDLEEEEKEEEKRLRNLETANIFEDVRIIDPIKDSYYYIMRWIAVTARQTTSSIILYPYYFNYTYQIQNEGEETTTVLREYKQGAFISLNSTDLNRFNNIGMNTSGTLSTKKQER